jgi:hypothetical protein
MSHVVRPECVPCPVVYCAALVTDGYWAAHGLIADIGWDVCRSGSYGLAVTSIVGLPGTLPDTTVEGTPP